MAKASQDGAVATYAGMDAFRTAGTTITLTEVDTANADMLTIIEGIAVVTVQGTIQPLFGSETAASGTQTLMADSAVVIDQVL